MLKHEFIVKETKKNIDADGEFVSIDDSLILEVFDKFDTIFSFWNNESALKNGLNYYGYSWICGGEVVKFAGVLSEFVAENGDFLGSNELKELENLINLCISCIKQNKMILHLGV